MATSTPEASFSCAADADTPAFLFRRMQGSEELGRLSEYRVELLRRQDLGMISVARLMGTKATVKLLRTDGSFRYINGWITAVELGGAVGRFDIYRIDLRPWLWHLTLGADCRIYQDKNALEIIQAVFADYSSAVVDTSKLSGTPRTRAYCVQYRESDFAFVSRLMEDEGIWYYFTHVDGNHTLVLANAPSSHVTLPENTLDWSPVQTDDHLREDIITQWRFTQQLRSLKFTHDDYDHEAPTTDLKKEATRTVSYPTPGDLEVYDYPGTYTYPGDTNSATEGQSGATLEVNRFESSHDVASAATPCRSVTPGMTFTYVANNGGGSYLITAVNFEMDIGDHEATRASVGGGFSARMQLVPQFAGFATEAITPKPIVRGPQTAEVVGPSGDEIHVDRLGRVKVHFKWDRVGPKDGQDTCYVRVATPWASKTYGMITIPRIGDEVVVSFLEGNPDRPLITGSVWNGDNLPPYKLPAHASVSTIKSRSTTQGAATNFNELRFEDNKGSEYVWFQAEKDFHRLVKHDATDKIGNNNQVDIARNNTVRVGGAEHMSVGGSARLKVGGDGDVEIGGELRMKVTGDHATKAGSFQLESEYLYLVKSADEMSLKSDTDASLWASQQLQLAGQTIVINASTEIKIIAGSSSIVLGPSGITLTGAMIKNNSGGGASHNPSASIPDPTPPEAPAAPREVPDPLEGEVSTPN